MAASINKADKYATFAFLTALATGCATAETDDKLAATEPAATPAPGKVIVVPPPANSRNPLMGNYHMQPGIQQVSPEIATLMKELRFFSKVVEGVREHAAIEPSVSSLFEGALRGMLKSIDPHSSYMNQEEYESFMEDLSGTFSGVGLEFSDEKDIIEVAAPIEGAPGDRAGIKAGDVITHIDAAPTRGMTTDQAAEKIRGDKGTTVTLTIYRPSDKETPVRDIVLTREAITTKAARGHVIDNDIGYVRLTRFDQNAAEAVKGVVEKLEKSDGGKLKGYILDLRGNPGGSLNASVDISDSFLNAGQIVAVRSRNAAHDVNYEAEPGDIINGKPLVVLVDEGSASASEIVAGALQGHKRATIMGPETTFGKGSVQSVLPLHKGPNQPAGAVKLTIQLYYTPDGTPEGHSIQGHGIVPDIKVMLTEKDPLAKLRMREAELTGTLANPDDRTAKKLTATTTQTCAQAVTRQGPVVATGLDDDLMIGKADAKKVDWSALCAAEFLRNQYGGHSPVYTTFKPVEPTTEMHAKAVPAPAAP